MTGPCPACHRTREPRKYLCLGCWKTLTPTARARLGRRGDGAIGRYQALLEQLRVDRPLPDVDIPD